MQHIKCDWCGYVCDYGETYYEWDDRDFCSMECLEEYVMTEIHPLERQVGRDDRF